MKEEAVQIGSTGLVGVLAEPDDRSAREGRPGVLLLNSGLIAKSGPNRLYVTLARRLAEAGHVVLRFDLSAIGDSPVRDDTLPFRESSVQETREAMAFLAETRGVREFVLAGICTGAVVAFETALEDPAVTAIAMVNAQDLVTDTPDEARAYIAEREQARYYIKNAALRASSWAKLLTGRASYRAILQSVLSRLRPGTPPDGQSGSPEAQRVRAGMQSFARERGPVLLLYSAGDRGIDELRLILGPEADTLYHEPTVRYVEVPRADHMFTRLEHQDRFVDELYAWTLDTAAGKEAESCGPVAPGSFEDHRARRDTGTNEHSGTAR